MIHSVTQLTETQNSGIRKTTTNNQTNKDGGLDSRPLSKQADGCNTGRVCRGQRARQFELFYSHKDVQFENDPGTRCRRMRNQTG